MQLNGNGRRGRKGEGLSPGTVKSYCLKANSILRFAHGMGWCDALQVPLESVGIPDAEWWRVDELRALLDVASDTLRIAYLLGARAGLRRGEIVELRRHDLQLDRGRIRIARAFKKRNGQWVVGPTKGGKAATVYIPQDLVEELTEYIGRHRIGRRGLVLQQDGKRLNPDDLIEMIQADAKAAGVYRPGVGTHTLRHTFCSHMVLGGAPIMTIKIQARHASITTTERYMHLAPEDVEHSVRYLPGLDPENHRNSVETSGGEKGKSPENGA